MEPKFIITSVAVTEVVSGRPEEPNINNDFNGSPGFMNAQVTLELIGSGDFTDYMDNPRIKIANAIIMGDIELKGYNNI